jgi:hypothetical protein
VALGWRRDTNGNGTIVYTCPVEKGAKGKVSRNGKVNASLHGNNLFQGHHSTLFKALNTLDVLMGRAVVVEAHGPTQGIGIV